MERRKPDDLQGSLTHQQMREILFGPEDPPQVHFKTHSMLDVKASHEAGHRVERPTVYVALSFPESKHSMIYRRAKPEDISSFPREFALYQEEIRNGSQDPYEGWEAVGSQHPGREHGDLEAGGSPTIGSAIARARKAKGGEEKGGEESGCEEIRHEESEKILKAV